jgi:AcrR family transcriptional regulator
MVDDDTAREQVIGAADALFYARGIQSVGMDEVRTAAGISLKRMYALFPSKDAIIVEVLARRNRTWNTGIARATGASPEPTERLLAIFDFLAEWFAEDDFRGCAFINSFGELGATNPAVADAVRAQKSSFQSFVAGLVSDAGAPAFLAPQLALLAEGAQTTAAISGNPDAATQARAAAATLIGAALPAAA